MPRQLQCRATPQTETKGREEIELPDQVEVGPTDQSRRTGREEIEHPDLLEVRANLDSISHAAVADNLLSPRRLVSYSPCQKPSPALALSIVLEPG